MTVPTRKFQIGDNVRVAALVQRDGWSDYDYKHQLEGHFRQVEPYIVRDFELKNGTWGYNLYSEDGQNLHWFYENELVLPR